MKYASTDLPVQCFNCHGEVLAAIIGEIPKTEVLGETIKYALFLHCVNCGSPVVGVPVRNQTMREYISFAQKSLNESKSSKTNK